MNGELDGKVPTGPIEQRWDQHKFDMRLVAPHNRRRFKVIVVGTGLAGGAAAATLERSSILRAGFVLLPAVLVLLLSRTALGKCRRGAQQRESCSETLRR